MTRLGALLRAAICGAGAMLALGMTAYAVPETGQEGVYRIGIPVAVSSDTEEIAPLMPSIPAEAEIQSVWTLGGEGRWDGAAGKLQALRAQHPGWQPPESLNAFVTTGQRDHTVRSALMAGDWVRVLSLLPAPAEADCERSPELWARADALEGAGEPSSLRAFYVRVLTNCNDPGDLAALLARAANVLDGAGLETVVALPSLASARDPHVAQAYAQLTRAHARHQFQSALLSGDLNRVQSMAATSDDPELLAQAGWSFLETDAHQAADYFQNALTLGADAEARRGLVMSALAGEDFAGARAAISGAGDAEAFAHYAALADLSESRVLRQQGDWLRATELAARAGTRDPALAGEAAAISGGALLDAAGSAYDQGDYRTARSLARRAAAYPSVARAADMRAGWADLQAGEAELALATFSRLYSTLPDAESAEGLALAAQQSGKLDSAAAIARAFGGPLEEKVQAQFASAAFYRGDYLTAKSLAPATYSSLEGADHTAYRQTLALRQQDGVRGENRMTGFASVTTIETARGVARYEAGLTVYRIDTGAAGNAGRDTFAAPHLGWSREGKTSLAARVGLLPVGGGAGPAVTGEAAAVRRYGSHTGEARIFVRPRMDSLLAFAGQANDPGSETGRVSEAGALVRGRFDIGGGRALQAEVSASRLDGRRTVSNSMVSTGLSATQSIRRDGFDYLVTGPFYQFQSYDRNTNLFSAGHGGYFSPQQFHRTGWSVNARTTPLGDWIVKADGAIAYETVREDAAVQFPLRQDQGTAAGGGRSSGVAGAMDVALARRLGSHVILSANLSATASEAFKDLRAGIGLVWVPGGRASVMPTDLATDPFSPGSWIRP